eukprot:Lithocolla_globosa_v1_NODE_3223_length_1728_cov_8.187687.p2 type:complete len:140 gc:universal NODE_3223_length_1728_cov_8.187687:1039-1458(+)
MRRRERIQSRVEVTSCLNKSIEGLFSCKPHLSKLLYMVRGDLCGVVGLVCLQHVLDGRGFVGRKLGCHLGQSAHPLPRAFFSFIFGLARGLRRNWRKGSLILLLLYFFWFLLASLMRFQRRFRVVFRNLPPLCHPCHSP